MGVLCYNTGRDCGYKSLPPACIVMQSSELRARPDQATISISDGGDVCQAYTNNKGEKNNN